MVAQLKEEVNSLKLKNAALEAEIEIYRTEMGGKSFSEKEDKTAGASGHDCSALVDSPFFKSGNGVYCKHQGVLLKDAHGLSNPLCLSLSQDETVACSGGADGALLIYQWGAISAEGILPGPNRAEVALPAPVIGVAAAKNMIAATCMDGSVHIIQYSVAGGGLKVLAKASTPQKHSKFCRNVLWSNDIVVSAAADGDVHLHRVKAAGPLDEELTVNIQHWKSLHLGVAVEAACLYQSKLILYTRETNFLLVVDLEKDLARSKVSLNEGVAGGFSEHVSFAVLDLKIHDKYLACATDANRHIIIDMENETTVRNLYGHQADGYSTPKLSWSSSGQYIYCNTQHSSNLIIYEVASGKIIEEISKSHTRPIKDLYSASSSDMLLTTSFDRQTCIWFPHDN